MEMGAVGDSPRAYEDEECIPLIQAINSSHFEGLGAFCHLSCRYAPQNSDLFKRGPAKAMIFLLMKIIRHDGSSIERAWGLVFRVVSLQHSNSWSSHIRSVTKCNERRGRFSMSC